MSKEDTAKTHVKYVCTKCRREFTPGAHEWAVFCSYACEIAYYREIYGDSKVLNWDNN